LCSCLFGLLAIVALRASGQARAPEALLRDADAAYDRGDVQQAIRLYEELLQTQPDRVEARTNLGVALARAGRYGDAVVQYNEALQRAPDNPSILLDLALAWYKQAAFDKAAAGLEHLRGMHPESSQSLYLLADCYLRLGRNLDVVALLQPVYDADPHDRAVDFALGTALIRAGQIQRGEVIIDQVAKTGSQNEVDLLTGAAQLAAHDSKAAAITIHKALEAAPDLPGAWSLYGRALLDSGDREGARTAFQWARMLRPTSMESRFQIGLLNVARGRLEDALSDLEQVERQSPDFKEVHVQLAALYARLHRIDDSERERALVVQLDDKAREQVPRQPQP
jgi:Flp pilus assembly protein TadD